MKTVGVDLRCLPSDGSSGAGIAHAARELWPVLARLAHERGMRCVAFCASGASGMDEGEVIRLHATHSLALHQAVKKEGISSLFFPSGAVVPGFRVPCYPWVHDIAIYEHPEWFPQSAIRRLSTTYWFRRGVCRAPHVFVVSEHVRQTLIDRWNLQPQDITVTYEGVRVSEPAHGFQNDSEPYGLVLGSIEPRKNIPFLLAAWSNVCAQLGAGIRLFVAGSDAWNISESDVCRRYPFALRVVLKSDVDRDALIRGAQMVLVPSLYEGFGRVALEAMTARIPVIVSNRGAHPEIIDDPELCLDPTDEAAWTKQILRMMNDERWRAGKVDRCAKRSSQFSWEATASRILAILEEN